MFSGVIESITLVENGLRPRSASMMEFFGENIERLKSVNYFAKTSSIVVRVGVHPY